MLLMVGCHPRPFVLGSEQVGIIHGVGSNLGFDGTLQPVGLFLGQRVVSRAGLDGAGQTLRDAVAHAICDRLQGRPAIRSQECAAPVLLLLVILVALARRISDGQDAAQERLHALLLPLLHFDLQIDILLGFLGREIGQLKKLFEMGPGLIVLVIP